MRVIFFVVILFSLRLYASSAEGQSWPPSWQDYDVKMPESQHSDRWRTTSILAMKLLSEGKQIVAAMSNQTIAVIDVANGQIVRQSEPLPYEIVAVAVAPRKDRIIVGGGERLTFLGLSDLQKKSEIPLPNRVSQMETSPDQEKLVISRHNSEVAIVTISDAPELKIWPLPTACLEVAWLPDSQHFIAGADNPVVYASETGKEISKLNGDIVNADHKYGLSQDGKWFISYTDSQNVYRGDLVVWDVAEILAHNPHGTDAACYLSVPGSCLPALFLAVPLNQIDFAGVKGFDPHHPRSLPIITSEAQEDTDAVALPNGKVLFAKWNGHLYCWDSKKMKADNRWSDPIPPEKNRIIEQSDSREQQSAKRPINYGEKFQYGNSECLGFVKTPDMNAVKLESLLEIVDAKNPAKIVRSILLPPCETVEVASSPDGRWFAYSTGSPAQTYTVPLDEIRKNPLLLRTAIKIFPALNIIDTKTGEIFTDKIWENQGASKIQFDHSGTHFLCVGSTRDGAENYLLYDLNARRVVANGPIGSHEDNKVLLLTNERIVIGDYRHVAIYKSDRNLWVQEVTRNDLSISDRKMTASPDGARFILYNPQNCGELLSTKDLKSEGWIFPTLLLSRISGYEVTWPESNRLVARNGEKFEEFLIPRDINQQIIPIAGGKPQVNADGTLLSLQNGDENVQLDYQTGRKLHKIATTQFQRSWGITFPPILSMDGYNHIVYQDASDSKQRILVQWGGVDGERWLQIPGKNLLAYAWNGLWLIETPSGKVIR